MGGDDPVDLRLRIRVAGLEPPVVHRRGIGSVPLVAVRSRNTKRSRVSSRAAPSVTDDVASAPFANRIAIAAQSSVSIGFTAVQAAPEPRDRTEIAAQQVMGVDGVAQDRAAGLPRPVPRHGTA
jgi:hypothetical protein